MKIAVLLEAVQLGEVNVPPAKGVVPLGEGVMPTEEVVGGVIGELEVPTGDDNALRGGLIGPLGELIGSPEEVLESLGEVIAPLGEAEEAPGEALIGVEPLAAVLAPAVMSGELFGEA